MKKYTLLVIVMTLLNFLSGCATTDLKTVDVSSIDFSLHQLFSKQRSTIELGGRYRVKVIATTADGKVISNPDLSGVVVSSPNQSFSIIKHTPNKIEVLATSNALAMLNKKVYVLDVGLPDERAGVNQRKSFNVNWEAVKRVNYSGEDGQDGDDGSDGSSGSNSRFFVDGGDGQNGRDGSDGRSGQDVAFAVAFYNVSDLDIPGLSDDVMVLLYNLSTKTTLVTKAQEIVINTSGGNGGDGGDGGDGGSPGQYQEKDNSASFSSVVQGESGKGGDGGDGGSGGNAGDLTVYYVGQEVMNFIRPDVSGGRGGEGGQGGDGGSWGGSDGLGGHHGRFNKIQISKEAFIDKVQQGMSEEVLKRLQF